MHVAQPGGILSSQQAQGRARRTGTAQTSKRRVRSRTCCIRPRSLEGVRIVNGPWAPACRHMQQGNPEPASWALHNAAGGVAAQGSRTLPNPEGCIAGHRSRALPIPAAGRCRAQQLGGAKPGSRSVPGTAAGRCRTRQGGRIQTKSCVTRLAHASFVTTPMTALAKAIWPRRFGSPVPGPEIRVQKSAYRQAQPPRRPVTARKAARVSSVANCECRRWNC